jgi:hypothetical protein
MKTKKEAEYVDYADEERCEHCTMFGHPDSCTLVLGKIDPKGHCKFYAPKQKR